jgi:hypothetical protein
LRGAFYVVGGGSGVRLLIVLRRVKSNFSRIFISVDVSTLVLIRVKATRLRLKETIEILKNTNFD